MSKYSGIAHYQDFNELVKLLGQSNSTYDIDKITKAYKFAEKAHGDQRRVSGIPYILHPDHGNAHGYPPAPALQSGHPHSGCEARPFFLL